MDLLAIADNGELRLAEPLPQPLLAARAAVAADFGLAGNWLNAGANGPAEVGPARGFMSRVVTRSYGTASSFTSPAGLTRFTSSSSRWLTREEDARFARAVKASSG